MASYDATINLLVKGGSGLDRVTTRLSELASQVRRINATPIDLSRTSGRGANADALGVLQRRIQQLRDDYLELGQAQRRYATGERTGNPVGGNATINQLKAQAELLEQVARNSKIASTQFREMTVAAALAAQQANEAGRERLAVLSEAFAGGGNRGRMANVRGNASLEAVSNLLGAGQTVPRSRAALSGYIQELRDLSDLVPITSEEFRDLNEQATRFTDILKSADLKGQVSAITPTAGPATRLSSESAFTQRANYAKKVADLEYKQLLTGQQLVQAKLTETQQEELQNRLAAASNALAEGELDLARRLTNELRNQRILYERANRDQAALMRPTSMVAGAAESVTGKRPGGLPPVPGSPAAWLATGGVAEPEKVKQATDKTVDSQKRLNSLLNSTQILEQKTLQLKTKGVDIDLQINFLHTVENKLRTQGVNLTKQDLDLVDLELNALRNKLKLEKAVLDTKAAQTKANAAAAAPGRQKAKDRTAMMQNALIGGAFPLLFGGGVGAVAGGFAGGFIPGSPMMSIVTSALGTVLDQFAAAAIETGASLRDPIANFEKLKQANMFASKAQEFYIQKLIEVGRYTEAAGAIQARIIDVVGTQGASDLTELGKSSAKLSTSFAELNIQMQAAVAGPLGDLLSLLGKGVGTQVTVNKLASQGEQIASLKPEKRQEFLKRRNELLLKESNPQSLEALQSATDKAVKEFAKEFKQLPLPPISLVDREKSIKQVEEIYTELKDKERAQQQLKIQNAQTYADLVLSIQRQQADLNLQYERRAQDLRISNAEKQLELVKAIGDAQLQQLQNESKARQIKAGGGTGLAAEITAALDTYDIELQRIQQEAANAEQKAKLDIIKLDVDNERFKLDNAKTIARTNLDNQTRIQRINEQINRQNDEVARRRYDQDIQVASINLTNIRADAQANKTIAEAALKQRSVTEDQKVYYQAILNGFNKVIQESERAAEQVSLGFIKPSPLPTMAAAPALAQPGTGAIDNQVQKAKELTAQLSAIATGQNRVNAEQTAYLTLTEKTLGFVKQFQDQTKNIQDENEARKLRNRLLAEGVAPEIIEGELRVLELNRAFTEATSALDAQLQKLLPVKVANTNEAYEAALATVAELEATTGLTKQQEKLRDRLKEILDLRVQLGTAAYLAADGARTAAEAKIQTPQEIIQTRQGELKEEFASLINAGNVAIKVAEGISAAFNNSFKGIISGSMSAREALAGFFQGVADAFLDMAAQIIAKWIQMTILNSILRLFPGGGGGGGGLGFGGAGDPLGAGGAFWNANGNVFAQNGIQPFAQGGIVNSPTFFKFAKGGSMANGVMGEAGPEAILPLRRGANGRLGVEAMGGGSTSVVVNVDAQGTNVQGSEPDARALGTAISVAVQAEIVKQQRPGGLLAGTR